jgi:hypothetical protein
MKVYQKSTLAILPFKLSLFLGGHTMAINLLTADHALSTRIRDTFGKFLLKDYASIRCLAAIKAQEEKIEKLQNTLDSMNAPDTVVVSESARAETIAALNAKILEETANLATIKAQNKDLLSRPEFNLVKSEADAEFTRAWRRATSHSDRMKAAFDWFGAYGVSVAIMDTELDELVRFIEPPKEENTEKIVLDGKPSMKVGGLSLKKWYKAVYDLHVVKNIIKTAEVPEELRKHYEQVRAERKAAKKAKATAKKTNK